MSPLVSEWREQVTSALEYAPPPGKIAPGLLGWDGVPGFVCSRCASRLIQRGFSHLLKNHTSVWEGEKHRACFACA